MRNADRETLEVRKTDDVDIIVEVLTVSEHAKFEEKIRARGFTPDVFSPIMIRYKVHNITVDFMPTSDIAIGGHNKWYPDGFSNAISHTIDENTEIKILAPLHFLATKFEAFNSRGITDPRQSHNFEDIVFVLENRRAIGLSYQMQTNH